MTLLDSDFGDFPMGSIWEQSTQQERNKWIRLMLARLDRYGITNDRKYTEPELGALSLYIRQLIEGEGRGNVEPPNFTTRALDQERRNLAPPIAIDDVQETPSGGGGGTAPIDPAQVLEIVEEAVADWAEEGNTDIIPLEKLPPLPDDDGGFATEEVYNQVPNLGSTESFFIELGATEGDQEVAIPEDEWWLVRMSIPSGNATDISPYYQWVRTADIRSRDAVEPSSQPVPSGATSVALSFTENAYSGATASVNAETLYFGRTATENLVIAHATTGAASLAGYRLTILQVVGGGGSASVDPAQVRSIVASSVADWAEEGNTDNIPLDKLGNVPPGLTTGQVDARVSTWARVGNTDDIPLSKLGNAPSGGGGGLTQAQVDARVQAGVFNWAEEGNTEQIPLSKLGNAPSGGGGGGIATISVFNGSPPRPTVAELRTAGGFRFGMQIPVTIPAGEQWAIKIGESLFGGETYLHVATDTLRALPAAQRFDNYVGGGGRGTDDIRASSPNERIYVLGRTADYQLLLNSHDLGGLTAMESAPTYPTSVEIRQMANWLQQSLDPPNAPADWAVEGSDDDIPASKIDEALSQRIIPQVRFPRPAEGIGRVLRSDLLAVEPTDLPANANWVGQQPDNLFAYFMGNSYNEAQNLRVKIHPEWIDVRSVENAVAEWAREGSTTPIPAGSALRLATELPTAENAQFGRLFGIGPNEGTEAQPRIEPNEVAYLKHRDAQVAELYTGRLIGDLEVYGYSSRTIAGEFQAGGAMLPGGVAPDIVEEFIHGRIANTAPFIAIIVNTTQASPFSDAASLRWQWKRPGETTWTDGETLTRDPSFTESNNQRYVDIGTAGRDLFLPTDEVIQLRFRNQDGSGDLMQLFSTDRFVRFADEDRIRTLEATLTNTVSRQRVSLLDAISGAGGGLPEPVLIGTWTRDAQRNTSTEFSIPQLAGSPLRETIREYRTSSLANNAVNFSYRDLVPRTATDMNSGRFLRQNFPYTLFKVVLTDASDGERWSMITNLQPQLESQDALTLFDVCVVKLTLASNGLTASLGAVVYQTNNRLKIFGYAI